MNDRLPGPLQGLEGAADEVFAGLGEDFDGDVVRNVLFLDQATDETELGFRCRRESDFDFLETDGAERLEHLHLPLGVHRLEEGLVAVAQIGAHPDRRLVDDTVRPLAVAEADWREGLVLGGAGLRHLGGSGNLLRWRNLTQ
ncbi:hypothetical protein SDC9_156697 [bioreactor metagenome]|uniref:Uncharacterized protein n=1 Tax=bioreactor metagenome TaxID=1076179 RepID=A0A645F5E3_9ZZZZ